MMVRHGDTSTRGFYFSCGGKKEAERKGRIGKEEESVTLPDSDSGTRDLWTFRCHREKGFLLLAKLLEMSRAFGVAVGTHIDRR
jgi:hypothetical protein